MRRIIAFFLATGGALASAQGFSAECSGISLKQNWLVATCPTGNGDKTLGSSVYLPHRIKNNDGNLEWGPDGEYQHTCKDCTLLDRATYQCNCQKAAGYSKISSINLEEHIGNYEGHLLSNITGRVTTVPDDSPYPVPSDFRVQLMGSTLNNSCAITSNVLVLNDPTRCWYLNLGERIDYTWACGNSTNNQGWQIVGFSDKDCTSAPVATFSPENEGDCLTFSTGVKGFSITPLWNSDPQAISSHGPA